MFPMEILASWSAITGTTNITQILKFCTSAATLFFVYLPLFQNRLNLIIWYRQLAIAGRGFQPNLLLRESFRFNILFFTSQLFPKLTLNRQGPVDII